MAHHMSSGASSLPPRACVSSSVCRLTFIQHSGRTDSPSCVPANPRAAQRNLPQVRQESQRARVAAQSAVSEAHIAEAQVLYYRPSRGLSTLAASCPAHFPSPWCPIAPCPPVPPMHAYTKPLIRTPGAINVDNFMQPEIPAGFHRTFPPPCNPPYFPYINPTGPPSPRMDNPIGSTEGRTGRISTQSASGATRTSTGTSGSSGTQY
eukprot:GEMP01049015.1.p1 GENE.GEMP01049015.1~~GEMP01049015.1.p1  ORF type:complete len:207 (+),score=20.64 GEMP01049015.1:334-954(+)